jgi:site-specific DNA-methyltransferase (adenine-specific)
MKSIEEIINKVHNSDCLEFLKEIPDNSVDLVLTDPPYGMGYQSGHRTNKHDCIEGDKDLSWFPCFIKETYRVLKDNSHCYLFCNDYCISLFRNESEKVGFNAKRTLVWVKNNHTSGDLYGDYANKTEFIVFLQKGRRLLNGKRESNVLYYDRDNTDIHPTKKPESIMSYLISKSTNENDIVCDPYLGGGTTVMACKALNRRYIGIEISSKYCDIVNRIVSEYDRQLKIF